LKLGVILIHGIGNESPNWADEKIQKLKEKILEETKALSLQRPPASIDDIACIASAFWKDVFKDSQTELQNLLDEYYESKIKNTSNLGFWSRVWLFATREFRKLQNRVISWFVGDIIGYMSGAMAKERVYEDIKKCFVELRRCLESSNDKAQVTFVTHSLGTVIGSDFIYDYFMKNSKKDVDLSDHFLISNIFTIGSPIALFSLKFGGPGAFRKPIHVQAQRGRWLNILDLDDPVAMPLAILNEEYKKAVWADIQVDAGKYGVAHTEYFNKSDTMTIIAKKIAIDWAVLNKHKDETAANALYEKFDHWVQEEAK